MLATLLLANEGAAVLITVVVLVVLPVALFVGIRILKKKGTL